MKIKLFIVTYRNSQHLCENLLSLVDSTDINRLEVYVINNHSDFCIGEQFNTVKIIHNAVRPDFSTGHLARNWNQAIINGFKSILNPDCDILITAQDDTIWQPGFLDVLIDYHRTHSFMTFGDGDNVCSYTIDAIKRIGIWDERFCNIGYQELDYFIRAIKFDPDNVSINDWGHPGRVHRTLDNKVMLRPDRNAEKLTDHHASMAFHELSRQMFFMKWDFDPNVCDPFDTFQRGIPGKGLAYMYYPYFERHIENLQQKYHIYENI